MGSANEGFTIGQLAGNGKKTEGVTKEEMDRI